MGHVSKKEQKLRGRSKSRGCLTIMIFKGLDKPRILEISSYLILCASLFFIFYIVATLFLINKYFDSYGINEIQAEQIAELKIELIKETKRLERAKQRIDLMDQFIKEKKEQSPEPTFTTEYLD